MGQAGQALGLTNEALLGAGVVVLGSQELEGDATLQLLVAGLEHRAHPARAELALDDEASDAELAIVVVEQLGPQAQARELFVGQARVRR